MNLRVARSVLIAAILAAVGGSAVAGMSMGSGGSRNYDRDSGYYPGYGYGAGDREQRCRGDGPCAREGYRRDSGPGMRMGGDRGGPRQERREYRNQYRYGQGTPGYGPRGPADERDSQDDNQGYRSGSPDYGRGGPGYGRGAPSYRQGGGF